MKLSASGNFRAFQSALNDKMKVTRKTEAEGLNHACKNVAYRAAQFTAKTTAAKIESELRQDDLLAKLASASLKRTHGRYTRAEHRQEMIRIRKRRKMGVSALRASWANAVKSFGGSFRGGKQRPGGSASRGTSKKATERKLVASFTSAVITTNAFGKLTFAGENPILNASLDKAVGFVAHDMRQYMRRKIKKALQR